MNVALDFDNTDCKPDAVEDAAIGSGRVPMHV